MQDDARWCKIMQDDAIWCKMIQDDDHDDDDNDDDVWIMLFKTGMVMAMTESSSLEFLGWELVLKCFTENVIMKFLDGNYFENVLASWKC